MNKSALIFQVSLLSSSVIAIIVGGYIFNDLQIIVILLSVFNSIVYFSRLMLTYSLVGESAFVPIIQFAKKLPIAAICGSPLIGFTLFLGESNMNMLLWSLCFAASLLMVLCIFTKQWVRV